MSESKPKSGRGGSRKHPADCKCGNCPKLGRKKQERLSNPKLSEQILHDIRAYELEVACIQIEVKRLGIDLSDKNWLAKAVDSKARPDSLFKMLDRLKCHARGNPADTVNHLHDKPQQHEVILSLGEGMRLAMMKADERVRNRKQS